MGGLSIWHWLIILGVALLLFGSAATHAWWMLVAAGVLAGLGFTVLPHYRRRGMAAMALGVVIAAATVAIMRLRA